MPRRSGTELQEARRARRQSRAAETDSAIVLNAAARFLEVRSRSIDEVRRHLAAAGYPAALVDAAIARLMELGMLDDRAFARAWADSRDRARPRGAAVLRRELGLKGIDREVVTEVLAERSEAATAQATGEEGGVASADEVAADRLLWKSRTTLLRVADPRARQQRAYALLARNGFDPEMCRQVSARFVAAESVPED
jgi:regulatory protein